MFQAYYNSSLANINGKMNIKPITSASIKNGARAFVSSMGKSDALIPIILLELAVTGGRSYQAYKRGGFVEGRERLTEESIAAAFWLFGVSAFNKIGDAIGKKLLGFKNIDFDVKKEATRTPVENFIHITKQHGEKALKKLRLKNVTPKTLAVFKLTKVLSSILLTNVLIGLVLPKINQKITANYLNSIKELDSKNPKYQKGAENFEEFRKRTNKKGQKTSFTGMDAQTLLNLAYCFENDPKYRLISSDAGLISGRAYNARNKYERREILFRDLSAIYFYMFCRPHINTLFNRIQDGRSSRLDPVSTNLLHEHLSKNFSANQTYSAESFEDFVLGKKNVIIPDSIKFNNGIVELNELKGKITDDEFKIAEKMSGLQPKMKDKAILTKYQVEDVLKGGMINDPELLKNVFEKYSKGSTNNPLKFIPEKDLIKLKTNMNDYIQDILKKAIKSGENISAKTLKIFSRQNFWKNAFNLGAGFAVSGYFLSVALPKIQYWLTEKQTGKRNFPGIEQYDK